MSARVRRNLGTAFALLLVAVWAVVLVALLVLLGFAIYHAAEAVSRGDY